MKVVFAGPSIHGAVIDWQGIELRPPAAQGDVFAAVVDGATAIGLIDGLFGATASVWHKEILFALTQGVQVVGGASMGALRAAECAAFGMIPVGEIAAAYCAGTIDDDSLVAVTHGPAELGYPPLSDALVDMLATFDRMADAGIFDRDTHERLRAAASATFFEDRSIEQLVRAGGLPQPLEIAEAYRAAFVSIKRQDALAVIARLRQCTDTRLDPPGWQMETPPTWRAFASAGPDRAR